ncbi:MAG: hypothetical protein O3A20_05070, partial [Planctomycetota bacterium]|nr:hypothetical protein [Planctomycetota bacterium]
MALFRSRRPDGRLFLTRADGRSLRREVPAGQLERFTERVLERGGAELLGIWRRAGQASSEAVIACWPESIPLPERAMLGEGDSKSGPWLEASFPRGAALQEIAEDLARCLSGASVPERVVPEAVVERPAAPPAAAVVRPVT